MFNQEKVLFQSLESSRGLLVWVFLMSEVLFSCNTAPPKPTRIQAVIDLSTGLSTKDSPRAAKSEGDELPTSQLGYILVDPQTKEVLEHGHEDQSFIPASTSKIPTTFAALRILGPRFRFKTYLAYRGKIQGETLLGDLYLKGTGDPALKVVHLMDLAERLNLLGVRKISGHFYYDDSTFMSQEIIEESREPWAHFNTGVSALSHEFNQFSVYWRPSDDPSVQGIFSVPPLPFVKFGLFDRPTIQGRFSYQTDAEGDHWLLSPDQESTGKSRLPTKKASLATASVFQYLSAMHGIQLPIPIPGQLPEKNTTIAVHESPALIELVEGILEYSNNLMAELVNMAAAEKLVHRPVGVSESASLIQAWYKRALKFKPSSNYRLVNGSGLSSSNRISPRELAGILELAENFKFEGRSFENLLAVSGKKGDMENRLLEPGIAYRVWAKTGSMDFTNCIVGYLHSTRGRKLVFAIMGTDFDERSRLDQTLEQPSSEALEKAKKWAQKARRTQDQRIMRWVTQY